MASALCAAFSVDRASLARIDRDGRRFEIVADAGAELLAPGTALPVGTCSYFARAAEGRRFHEGDFDASAHFRLPLDGVVRATGFHAGCSVPVQRGGRTIGAVSLSAASPRGDMAELADGLAAVAPLLAAGIEPDAPTRASRVLVCHGDALAGRGIARLVERCGGARASVAASVEDALVAAAGEPPDLVVCDDWVGGRRVDEVAAALRAAGVDVPLLVVSSRDAPENLRASRRAGATAHVARADVVARLPALLVAVHRGDARLPEPPVGDGTHLTHREGELLRALEEGLRFKQVALRLGISEATAKTHGRNLFRKLGATSRSEAVHAARDLGLLA